ncbi:MAG: hypothetical protein E7257_06295 [Lachnospiraceae bacterium]|nr:hypothetical protein [Lachnospiraceae bacterium]MBQ9936622.1 hypothetical protein [Lachnospiraceae bacterium]
MSYKIYNAKKIKLIILLMVCIFTLSGCGEEKYYIPQKVLDVLGFDATEYSNEIKGALMYEGTYDSVYSENGDLIFVANEEQIDELLNIGNEGFAYYESVLKQYGILLECNDTYTEIVVKCKKEQLGESITEKDVKVFVAEAAWNQALTGVKPEDLYVYGVVKDIETNEIIYEYELYGR